MRPEAKLVPLGILEVDSGQLFLSLGLSAETSDFIADGIEDWWLTRRAAHGRVRKIVIDLDNGPNVQSHRQFALPKVCSHQAQWNSPRSGSAGSFFSSGCLTVRSPRPDLC